MPLTEPWTDRPPAERARSVIPHHWSTLASFAPDRWTLPFAVFLAGNVVGMQDIGAKGFVTRREVCAHMVEAGGAGRGPRCPAVRSSCVEFQALTNNAIVDEQRASR
jgi:hypothetical protein